MQTSKRLEEISTEIALDSAILHKVTEDGQITPDEFAALVEVRDDLRQQAQAIEEALVFIAAGLFMIGHAAPPNKHHRQRWARVQENAATVLAEAA